VDPFLRLREQVVLPEDSGADATDGKPRRRRRKRGPE